MAGRLAEVRRRDPFDHSEGFTLIELMIVILILAILVGIAVAVMLVAKNKAADSTAKANHRIGEDANSHVFLSLGLTGYTGSWQPTNWALYLSSVETKITWVRITAASNGSATLRINNGYKNRATLFTNASPNYYTFTQIYGRIGIYQGYLSTTNRWNNSGSPYRYITVIVLNQSNNRAFFSVYDLGTLIQSGSFEWQSTGVTRDFKPL